MVDYRERLAGQPTGIAQVIAAGTGPVQARPAVPGRTQLSLQPDGPVVVGIATAALTASGPGVVAVLASGAVFEERDYLGPVFVRAEAGATALVRVWEV